jgi:hypothetical protein
MKARVLDILFSPDTESPPYFSRMVLRFGDTNTQLVVFIYPGGKCELVQYGLKNMSSTEFSEMVSKMTSANPKVTDKEIAMRLKVDISRSPIDLQSLNRALIQLRSIKISPVLTNRLAGDEFSEYEFSYDTWEESVHYTIIGPFGGDPQDQLGHWMIEFKSGLPNLLQFSKESKP